MGVFVQTNESSKANASHPTGYIIQENGCWEWVGARISTGYGETWHEGRAVLAHRMLYEQYKGPIQDGWTIDHLCRNRGCVNPAHLEQVTNRHNILRGTGRTAINARKTHCKNGHVLEEGNFVLYELRRGQRACLICKIQKEKDKWTRKKATRDMVSHE